jgi:hypothetical protein
MFETNKLLLTAEGAASLANADAGGFKVNPKTFKVGDSALPPSDVQSDLIGLEIAKGQIHYVQVLGKNSALFTIDIPASVGTNAGVDLTEVVVYLEDGTALASCYFTKPFRKFKGRGVRIQLMLHSTESELTTLNVTLSEYGSIPSVPSVEDLPSPVDSLSNAISVLTLQTNPTGNTSPGIVCSYGEGKKRWGFYGFTQIFDEVLGSGFISTAEFELPDLINVNEIESDESLIIQVISGPGAGQTRNAKVNNESLVVENAFVDVTESSFISVWRLPVGTESSSSCTWPPEGSNIPEDWVLKRGSGTCPVWAPPASTVSSNTRLYRAPSKLAIESLTTSGTLEKTRYNVNQFPENANYLRMNMSGINNHKTGFSLDGDVVEIFENFPSVLDLEFRTFIREPSTGTKIGINPTVAIGDGVTKRFKLNTVVKNAREVLVFVDTAEQMLTSYTIDEDWLEFTEAPPSGVEIELNPFAYTQVEGYSTDIHVSQLTIGDPTNVIQLPITPESKNLVFVSSNGLAITKQHYGLAGNKLVFNAKLNSGSKIEVMVLENVLSLGQESDDLPGVITGAVTHANGIDLFRHNLPPIRLPAPEFEITEGAGIKVEGKYPNFKITSLVGDTVAEDKFRTVSAHKNLENTETLILTKRVSFKGDISIAAAANFAARLGPGFNVDTGSEAIEYVVGVRSPSINESEFGREVEGSGEAGFSFLKEGTTSYAHTNVSQNMSYNIKRANNPAGYVDIIAKVRIVNAKVNAGARITASLNLTILPNL